MTVATRARGWLIAREATATLSDEEIRNGLQGELDEEKDPDNDGDDDSDEYAYVVGVYDGFFIYCVDGDYFKRSYTLDADDQAEIGDDVTPVRRKQTWLPLTQADDDSSESATAIVSSLDNRTGGSSFDRAYVEKMIPHHEAAMHAANKAAVEAVHPELKKHAAKVAKSSGAHLSELHGYATQWFGVAPTPVADPDNDGDNDLAPGTKPETDESYRGSESAILHEVFSDGVMESDSYAKGEIVGTAIKPGFNRSGQRYYPKETLAKAVDLFPGKKMYFDHPSASEARNRPERSIRDIGAVIKEAWVGTDGEIKYRAVLVDPELEAKLALMNERGVLERGLGTSVNYVGTADKNATVEGRRTHLIESFDELNSLDFVTEPGAWGDVAHMESDAGEPAYEEGNTDMADDAVLQTMSETINGLKAQLDASEAARRVERAQVRIEKMVEATSLPTVAKDRLLEAFADFESTEGVQDTIDKEIAFIASVLEGAKVAAKVDAPKTRPGVIVGLGNTGNRESGGAAKRVVTRDEASEATDWLFGDSASAKQFFESHA